MACPSLNARKAFFIGNLFSLILLSATVMMNNGYPKHCWFVLSINVLLLILALLSVVVVVVGIISVLNQCEDSSLGEQR